MTEQPSNGPVSLPDAFNKIGGQLGDATRETASAAVEAPKKAGADVVDGVSRAVHKAAEDIERESPLVGGYVRDAASNIDKMAKGLREHTVGDIVDMVANFGRRQPVAFFAASVVAGFAMSRFVKSGMAAQGSNTEAERREGNTDRDTGNRGTGTGG